MNADESGAIVIANNNFFPNRNGHKALYVIIHGTASNSSSATAVGTANYFINAGVTSHYIIDKDGSFVQCVAEKDGAWANGGITGASGVGGDGIHHDSWWSDVYKNADGSPINPNNLTIAIEHVKYATDNSDILTPAQQATSLKLVYDICIRNNIPLQLADKTGGVTGHFSMDPVNKSRCPGPYPWSALLAYFQSMSKDAQIAALQAQIKTLQAQNANQKQIITQAQQILSTAK